MAQALGAVLHVVGPAQHNAAVAEADKKAAEAADAASKMASINDNDEFPSLAGYVRGQFDEFQRHRNSSTAGWSERLLQALRSFNGQYDTAKRAEIEKFGGSQVYARIIAMKCRGASSLLRDVYLSTDRPWGLDAPDDPEIPADILTSIKQLVDGEVQSMAAMGEAPDIVKIRDRSLQLVEAARQAAKKKQAQQTKVAEDKIDELLKSGGFYKALAEFITDLPLYPFACIKGPVVRIQPVVTWEGNRAVVKQQPKMTWQRVSPFDLWWTPGVSDIEDASVVERIRYTRADLNDLLDLPGYNHDAIREVLDLYGAGGLADHTDGTDSERADNESRENPQMNQSGLITALEFTGNVQGRLLLQEGMPASKVPDELRDYFVQAWVIGNHTIKVQIAPSPRRRHPYYITSFEKVPGTPVGNGLPDILSDVQEAGNATLRALVNNLSIASGPQVVINEDRISPDENPEELYPWKRWRVTSDPMGRGGGSEKPVDFFQPSSNAQELLGVYQKFVDMADELSAIPKYLQGSGAGGGAGRTASGLAMLMGNASKILQTVAANIDRDVIDPLLGSLYDMIMLTDDSGLLSGTEKVRVLGVSVATQRETMRARQLEFLQITNNPADMQIIGPAGRAEVLRAVSTGIGLDGSKVVPSQEDIEAQQKKAEALAAAQNLPGAAGLGDKAAAAQGMQDGTGASGDMGPRTNISGG
jgi:hypothetical protein